MLPENLLLRIVYISDLFGLRAKCLSEQFEQKELLTPAFPSYTTQHISTHSSRLRTCFVLFFFTTVLNKGESRRLHKQGLCLECNQDSGQQRKTDSRGELWCHCSGGIT